MVNKTEERESTNNHLSSRNVSKSKTIIQLQLLDIHFSILHIYIVITSIEKSRDRTVVESGVKHHSNYPNPMQNVNDIQTIQIRKIRNRRNRLFYFVILDYSSYL